jgi:hypothetical protein
MAPISKRARHLKKIREIKAQKLEAKKTETDDHNNPLELTTITKEWYTLHTIIDELLETEVKPTNHLLNNMRYPKGKKQGQVLSIHLQNKAVEYVTSSIYKPNSSVVALDKKNAILKKEVKRLEKKNSNALHQIKSLGGKLGRIKKKQTKQIAKIHANARRKKSLSGNTIKSYLILFF